MEKFTKGKWRVMPIEDDKECIRIRGTVLGGRFKIANVSDLKNHHYTDENWCKKEREESLANAALIAAAPEMYEMLKDCLSVLVDGGFFIKAENIGDLLAKARGEK